MRLFVAVEVGPDVQRAAARVVDELKRRVERSAPHARVTWVQPDRLHLTVRFIGEADEALSHSICAALESPLATNPFDLTIAGIGSFPPGRPPRVLWAGLTAGLGQLRAVEREVQARLEAVGVLPEDRDHQPHLTLARVRHASGLRPVVLLEGLENTVLGTRRVEAVTLFESRLSPTAPTYVALHRMPLGGA